MSLLPTGAAGSGPPDPAATCAPDARAARPADAAKAAWGDRLTEGPREHVVRPGDSLTLIGARYGVPPGVLARDNGLAENARLRPGDLLAVDARHVVPEQPADGILVNVPQRMLFHRDGGRLLGAYPIAAGRPDWPTPRGAFHVVDLQVDKPWIVPPSIQREMAREGKPVLKRVEPGPENPLGRHWIGLSIPAIGVHGTNAPASLFALRSHGCIRLHPDDAAELHGRVVRGTPGRIVYHRVLMAGLADGRVFVEVHPDAYRLGPEALGALRALARDRGLEARIDWAAAQRVARLAEGVARDVTVRPTETGESQR